MAQQYKPKIFLVLISTASLMLITGIALLYANEWKAFKQEKEVRLRVEIDKAEYKYPETVKINVFLDHGYAPILYADVKAIVIRPDGSKVTIPLNIPNAAAMGFYPHGGEYYNVFGDYAGDGIYKVLIVAKSNAQTRKGTLFIDPLHPMSEQPKLPELQQPVSFHISAQIFFRLREWVAQDKVPPGEIYNFYLEYKPKPTLFWSASGDNGYSGRTARYEVRYLAATAENIEAIRNHLAWEMAKVYPQEMEPKASCASVAALGDCCEKLVIAGSLEGRYFFAVKALDAHSNASKVSPWVLVEIN